MRRFGGGSCNRSSDSKLSLQTMPILFIYVTFSVLPLSLRLRTATSHDDKAISCRVLLGQYLHYRELHLLFLCCSCIVFLLFESKHRRSCSFHRLNHQTIAIMVSSPSAVVIVTLISSLFVDFGLPLKTHGSAQRACSALKASLAETQTSGDDYDVAKGHYWNAASRDDTPTCVTFPTNAEEVSDIVKVLQKYTDVEFAMKSGGHNPNRGFSSVDGGVLISFSKLASTTYNPDLKTADGSCSSNSMYFVTDDFLLIVATPEKHSLLS
jgi:hypothetical protein